MTPVIDISTTLWFAVVVDISMILALLLLRTDRIWDGARFWIAGNLVALLSVLIQLLPGWDVLTGAHNRGTVPASLLMLSHLLKVLALSRRRARLSVVLIGGGVVAAHWLIGWGFNGLIDEKYCDWWHRLGVGAATQLASLDLLF